MRTVVGFFDRFETAEKAVRQLVAQGFERDDISLVARDATGDYARELGGKPAGQQDGVADGAARGAEMGAVLGGLGGLLAGLGALAIPGIGPVVAAGPVVATLVGAGVGAAAGGIIGALVDLGIPEEHAGWYAEGIRRGGTLVVVRSDNERANNAAAILNRFNPVDISSQVEVWRRDRWEGFDESADPLPVEVLENGQVDEVELPVTGNEVSNPAVVRDGQGDLRNEYIGFERRQVEHQQLDDQYEPFQEWTMEFEEVIEEPVIHKRPEVVEEVRVTKEVETEEETIRDRLLRQEVDVQRVNAAGERTGNEDAFQRHYQQRYARGGRDFAFYLPAYRYGISLAQEERYSGYAAKDWPHFEREVRQEWERRGEQSSWEEIKDAVLEGWNTIKRGVT